ncbi:MAG: hypothetical protein JEY79_04720 [Pseudodesulfovibrio sp.]|nr:hypothetical protein [Pseudodesulfovibrio sp.]
MTGWFKNKIADWKAQRKLTREINPRNFKQTAQDIRNLAVLASQLNPKEQRIRQLIKNILVEMDRLSDLADRPEFKQLSTGKRLLLRQGLKESRDQLLESIQSAPSPTETLQ